MKSFQERYPELCQALSAAFADAEADRGQAGTEKLIDLRNVLYACASWCEAMERSTEARLDGKMWLAAWFEQQAEKIDEDLPLRW